MIHSRQLRVSKILETLVDPQKSALEYVIRKSGILAHSRYYNRPVEVTYQDIADHTGYSYKQIRTAMQKIIEAGLLKKHTVFYKPKRSKTYWQLSTILVEYVLEDKKN